MRPIPIIECLNEQMLDIVQSVLQLDALNQKLKQYLPPNLSAYCSAGSLVKGCLIITTTDPAWATELRYILPALRDTLRKEAGLYQLISIKIAITMPVQQKLPTKTNKNIALSDKARETIQAASDQCAHLPLKDALYQLARAKKAD